MMRGAADADVLYAPGTAPLPGRARAHCMATGSWVPKVGPGYRPSVHALTQSRTGDRYVNSRHDHAQSQRLLEKHERRVRQLSVSLFARRRKRAAKNRIQARFGTRDDGSLYEHLTKSMPVRALDASQIAVSSEEGCRHILATLPTSAVLVLEEWVKCYAEEHTHGERAFDPWDSPYVKRVIATAAFFSQVALEAPAYGSVYRKLESTNEIIEVPVSYQVSGYGLARIAAAMGPRPGYATCWTPNTMKHQHWGPLGVLKRLGLIYAVQDDYEHVPGSHRGDRYAFNRYVLPEWAWPVNEAWGDLQAVGAHLPTEVRQRLAPEIWGDAEPDTPQHAQRRARAALRAEQITALAKLEKDRVDELTRRRESGRMLDDALAAASDAALGAHRPQLRSWMAQWVQEHPGSDPPN